MRHPGSVTVWTFYLFGDLFSTLMVATFFSFLNDSVTPEMAKRLYGLVGAGGVMGGAFGSLVVRVWIKQIAFTSWLWITFGLALVIMAIALAVGRLVDRNPPERETAREAAPSEPEPEKPTANPAVEGAKLVFASKYLLAIVAIVGLYEIASTIMDFQFTSTIEHFVPKADIGQHFSTIYTITNFTAMFVQLFLTSFIMTRFGVKTALLVLPVSILLASISFIAVPVLWVGSFLNTADNSFNYSINQSAKETLYVPTSRDEKYKAKAFIDMFVMRFAKAVAVVVSLGITTVFTDFSSIRWLSLFTVVIATVWFIAARYAGGKFHEITSQR
jgi:AAA family ATP:ADP antiporter